MENRNNIISIGQGAANLGRTVWSFQYPHQVVSDPTLGLDDKRAILAAWASDLHTVESLPTLRHLPGTPFPVTLSAIMDARLRLDGIYGPRDDDPVPPSPADIRQRRRSLAAREAA